MGRFARKRLGDILVEAGAITENQLREAITSQDSSNKKVGQLLVEGNLITEEKLVEILEEQLGIPQINLYNYNINPEVATLIPANLARRHMAIPIEIKDSTIIVAMVDPMNIIAIDDISLITGKDVEPVIASESSIKNAIDQVFSLAETLEVDSVSSKAEDEEELAQLKALVEDAPIVKVVNSLIHQAVNEGASDIHIEPSGKGVRVRMRIDGALHDLMTPPKDTQPLIVSRIKIMSNLDIAEKRLPQDGRISVQVGLKDVNMRVSTMPTIHGEKVVIRLLDKDKVILPLEKLGFSKNNYELFTKFLMNHSGMILVTGPTGSGKTTTLYSALNYLNKAEDNIITVEDPVEYRLDGINQVQVNTRINMTFAAALRTILRQDPNIIMIGEIRDLETAEMATRAALTGHLVLSTLHTNDAASTITRLINMGVDKYLITSSLVGVIAQRLVRKICKNCLEEYSLSPQDMALFSSTFWREAPDSLFRGAGCRQCNNSGYRGRVAIHEMLAVDKEIQGQIMKGASAEELQNWAMLNGMEILLQDGLRRMEMGITTLEEVVKVAYSSSAGSDERSEKAAADTASLSVSSNLESEFPAEAESAEEFEAALAGRTGDGNSLETGGEAEKVPRARPEVIVEREMPEAACAGDTVSLLYRVANTGDVPLTGVSVFDSLLGDDWSHFMGDLKPGQEKEYRADFTVYSRENAPDSLQSRAAVKALHNDTVVESYSGGTMLIARPALKIERESPVSARAGETIECEYSIMNAGNVDLTQVTVTDPFMGEGWTYTIGDLTVDGITKFSMETVVPQGVSGMVEGEAAVSGFYDSREVKAADSFSIEIIEAHNSQVDLEISGPVSARPRETISYRFLVSNAGNTPLSDVKVTAPLLGKFWCNTIGNLPPGKKIKFSFGYIVPAESDGELVNDVTVRGRYGEKEVSSRASHHTEILKD